MNVSALRTAFLSRVDDPEGNLYSSAEVLGFLNDAYRDVVAEVERAYGAANVPETATVTVTISGATEASPQREHELAIAGQVVRGVFSARRTSPAFMDLAIVSYPERERQRRPDQCGYAFRRGNDGTWMFGLCRRLPPDQTVLVECLLEPAALTQDADEPHQVPAGWQTLIPLWAAIQAHVDRKRDFTELASLYQKRLALMQEELSRTRGANRVRGM